MTQMMQYDPAKRPSAAQILTHPYFTKSLKTSATPVWGEVSTREAQIKKKTEIYQNYQNPKDKVVNMQNHKNEKSMKIQDLDNDWDADFNDIMNEDSRHSPMDSNRGMLKGQNPSFYENSQMNSSKINQGNSSFLKNSGYNLKNEISPATGPNKGSTNWDKEPLDESFNDDEFDVFGKNAKPSNNFASTSKNAGSNRMEEKKPTILHKPIFKETKKKAEFDLDWGDLDI